MRTVAKGICANCGRHIEDRWHPTGQDWFHVWYDEEGWEIGYAQQCEDSYDYAEPAIPERRSL